MTRRECQLFGGALPLRFDELGNGASAFLLLHGGAGPASMMGLAGELAGRARVLVPTHPGFDGTSRPAWFTSVRDLALAYLSLLDAIRAESVVLVGSSLGGWLAAEMAACESPRIRSMALMNAVGIEGRIANPTAYSPSERFSLSFHDPERFAPRLDAANEPLMRANQQALLAYSGAHFMHDPSLEARLGALTVKTLVLWGESDRIVDVAYGRRLAGAIPGSAFELVPRAGHFPHIERPDVVPRRLTEFASA